VTVASESAGLPLLLLLVGAVATYVQARALRGHGAGWTGFTAFGIMLAAFGVAVWLQASDVSGRFLLVGLVPLDWDGLAALLSLAGTGLGMAVSLYSTTYLPEEPSVERFYPLLCLMTAGIVGVGLAVDLFSLFVFFELMAIASYALVAYPTKDWEPVEAGMKYVIMSGSGSLVALMGISLLFFFTGTMDLTALRAAAIAIPPVAAIPIIALLTAGFGLKAAIVPLHTWLPDAHSAAPSGISAMLSGIVIQTGLVTLVKSVGVIAGAQAAFSVGFLLSLLAVLTMTLGNLLALHQSDLKRMLAYSSVAQVGYILLGFGLWLDYGVRSGAEGALFHILNHAVLKGGAFLAAGVFLWQTGTRDMDRLAGIGRATPLVGAAFAVSVLGLAGVPPMSGFLSKLLIAKAGLDAGGAWPLFFVIALAANSVLSLAYYVPALNRIVFGHGATTERRAPWTLQGPIVVLALITIVFGLFPDLPLQLVESAVNALSALFGGA
jgi:proton-translocating NADH-quinone oxidoreductase chain N